VDPDHLLDAAQAVFAEEGLRAASLRAIARRAGCDPALIYYHFASKETLFAALLQRRFPQLLEEMKALAAPEDRRPTAERLWGVLLAFHRHLKDDPGIRSMIRGELVRGVEGLAELIEAQVRPIALAVRSIVEQGIQQGELRPDLQPMLVAFFLVRMEVEILDLIPAVLPRLMQLRPEPTIANSMRAWFDLFWRGVAVDPFLPLPALSDPTEAQESHP
jgi:AcrR family transcriptional regulator